MAERLMPESAPQIILASRSGKEIGSVPISPVERETSPKSEFEHIRDQYLGAQDRYWGLCSVDSTRLPSSAAISHRLSLDEARNTLKGYKDQIMELVREAEDGHDLLVEIRQEQGDRYKELRSLPPASRSDNLGKIFAGIDWEKGLWQLPGFRALESKFKGLPNFLWEETIRSTAKDIRRDSLTEEVRDRLISRKDPRVSIEPDVDVGDHMFVELKLQREIDRLVESKVALSPYMEQVRFRVEEESEIIPAGSEWLNYAEKQVPNEAIGKVYEKVEEIRRESDRMLFVAVVRLRDEYGIDIEPDHKIVERMRTLTEARMNAKGGAETVNKGGFEYMLHFRENYANNFRGHWAATYAEDPNVALAFHYLSHGVDTQILKDSNQGEYFRGCPKEVARPKNDEIQRYQKTAQDKMIIGLASHELVLKARYDARVNDPEERRKMVLLSRSDRQKREKQIFAEERDRFLSEHPVFQETKARWDRRDAAEAATRGIPDLAKLVNVDGRLVDDKTRRDAVERIILDKIGDHDPLVDNLAYLSVINRTKNGEIDNQQKGVLIGEIRKRGISDQEKAALINEVEEGRVTQEQKDLLTDKKLWEWVEVRNKAHKDQGWYPTRWDEIRYLIDRPEKVLLRALSMEEFLQMYQSVDLPSLTPKEREKRLKAAIQSLQTAQTYMLFEGIASRYGGTRLEIKDENGKEIYSPFFAELWNILDKIEEVDFSTLPQGTGDDVDSKKIEWYKNQQHTGETAISYIAGDGKKREFVIKGKFVVRDLFRRYKMSGRLPMWSYYLTADDTALRFFADAMGVSPERKRELTEILEGERRILKQVKDKLVDAFMLDPDNNPHNLKVKARRVNWKGGNIDYRKLYDARMYWSTSGGAVATDLLPIMDLGIEDQWQMEGQEDAREFTSWVCRRDELEDREVELYNVLSPVDYNRMLGGAEELKKLIGGGKVKDRQVQGLLNDLLNGAYKIRVMAIDLGFSDWLQDQPLENLRWTNEMYDKLNEEHKAGMNKALLVAADVLKNLTDVFDARRLVEVRYPRAPKNWLYDNTEIWYRVKKFIRYSEQFSEPPFAYATQARTEFAIRLYEDYLEAAGYILPSKPSKGKPIKASIEFRESLFPAEVREERANRAYDAKSNTIVPA